MDRTQIIKALEGVPQSEVVRRAKAAGFSLSEGSVWMARHRGIKTVRVEEALRAAAVYCDAPEAGDVAPPPRTPAPGSP